MEDQINWIEQLKIMQSNIVSIFQGVIKERNDYKESNDFLATSLKQMIVRIDTLEKQNKILQECNANMRYIYGVGVKTFKKLDLSCMNSIKDNRVSLEFLQKLFLETNGKIEVKNDYDQSQYQPQVISGGQERNTEIDRPKAEENGDKIKLETDFKESTIPILAETEAERVERGHQSNENSLDEILRNTLVRKPLGVNVKRRLMPMTDASTSEQVNREVTVAVPEPVSPLPVINENVNGSPVFKGARRQDTARIEENKNSKSTPLKLINEKFGAKSVQLLSPWKSPQADGCSTSKAQFTTNRDGNNARLNSPKRSTRTPLKKSNLRGEAVSPGGRKLTQTTLNIDCFKSQNSVMPKNSKNREDGHFDKQNGIASAEDDDIIFDSPKTSKQSLENLKNEEITNNETRGLDETFISSPALRQFNSGQNRVFEGIMGNISSHKRAREKSPEYDSVPFVYKRETVRKRGERMKLPGHPCVECNKYYENAFGDLNTEDLKKILNKCSRHRDKNSPTLNDTPSGYWKPYLTCSIIGSPKTTPDRGGY